MALFDFISDEDFRNSLENDYKEIEKCLKTEAWKAVYVLSGSIIEALLLDYLTATEYEKRSKHKLRELTLQDMINVCEQEKVLSRRAAGISHAIRDYRNLIHPQKVKRLEEKIDGEGATVAQALVKMVINDVAQRKSERIGLTAEQLITKVKNDSTVLPILDHIIKNMGGYERRKFLLDVAPKTYLQYQTKINDLEEDEDFEYANASNNLRICFQTVFENSTDEIKSEAAKEFTRVIKEENEKIVEMYEEDLFKSTYLKYFSLEDRKLFKKHFLSRFNSAKVNHRIIEALDGIEQFLEPNDIFDYVYGLTWAMLFRDISSEDIRKKLLEAFFYLDDNIKSKILYQLNSIISNFKDKQNEHYADRVKALRDHIPPPLLPGSTEDFDPSFDPTVP